METMTQPGRRMPSLWTALRHHVPLLLLSMVVTIGAAGAYVVTAPATYTSTAVLLLSPVTGNPLSPEASSSSTSQLTVAMETESGIVSTPQVAALVSNALGRTTPAEHEQVVVAAPDGTQVLRISFTSDTPQSAREGAQAFADGYLAYRESSAVAAVEERLERLAEQAEQAEQDLRQATSQQASQEETGYAAQEVQLYADRLAQLNAAMSDTRSLSTQPGRLLNPAETPNQPSGLPTALVWLAGALAGLLLGLGLVLFREWRKDLVREDEELDIEGVPVFARVLAGGGGGVLTAAEHPVAHEAYRRLRAAVVANSTRPHVLAVAGIGDDHASPVAANLAVALAESDFSVLVVSANPDSRRVETLLGTSGGPGLSDVVLDRLDATGLVVTTAGVSVLPGGADPVRARELYGGPSFARLLKEFRPQYDYIVLDTAGTGTSDGDAVIGAADSALLAVASGRTTHAQVRAALDRFERLNIRTLGAVIIPRELGGADGDRAVVGGGAVRRPTTQDIDAVIS